MRTAIQRDAGVPSGSSPGCGPTGRALVGSVIVLHHRFYRDLLKWLRLWGLGDDHGLRSRAARACWARTGLNCHRLERLPIYGDIAQRSLPRHLNRPHVPERLDSDRGEGLQRWQRRGAQSHGHGRLWGERLEWLGHVNARNGDRSVSYTHLTLPTIYSV